MSDEQKPIVNTTATELRICNDDHQGGGPPKRVLCLYELTGRFEQAKTPRGASSDLHNNLISSHTQTMLNTILLNKICDYRVCIVVLEIMNGNIYKKQQFYQYEWRQRSRAPFSGDLNLYRLRPATLYEDFILVK